MTIWKLILCIIIALAFAKSTEGQQPCRTPFQERGECVEFKSCKPFFEKQCITPNDLEIIEKSWCGTLNGVRTICCPIQSSTVNSNFKSPTTTEPPTITEPPSTFTRNTDLSNHPNVNLIKLEDCGKSSNNKIFGGNITRPFEFPWMVMLQALNSNNNLFVNCGGTLISSLFVLTAAHCLRTLEGDTKIHSVVLGEHDTTQSPDCFENDCADPEQVILVERTLPHPYFNLVDARNDIGLVRLSRTVEFTDSRLPVCLPYSNEFKPLDNEKLIISGWGGTRHGPSSNVLMKALIDITPNDACSIIYRRFYFERLQINEDYLCAFDPKSQSCPGDSGGPATVLASTKFGAKMFQYGIVSAAGSRVCGQSKGIPGLYTRVTRYMKWILDNISE